MKPLRFSSSSILSAVSWAGAPRGAAVVGA